MNMRCGRNRQGFSVWSIPAPIHAAWALGHIGTDAARRALRGREEVEDDAWVWEEIGTALIS